jgi:hypothetical protein
VGGFTAANHLDGIDDSRFVAQLLQGTLHELLEVVARNAAANDDRSFGALELKKISASSEMRMPSE